MGLGEQIISIYEDNLIIKMLVVPTLLCAILYFIFRSKEEFSWHAIQNNAATITIIALNFCVGLIFVNDVNNYAQTAYAKLNIPTLNPAIWDNAPLWLIALAGILAKDFADYWNHRIMHTTWLWPTHAAHHSDTHVSAFTVFRVHFLEGIVMLASYIILLTWLQIPQAIPIVFVLYTIHGHYVHMNLPYTHGPLKYLIASPAFHRWHHADEPEAYGKNLSNLMPIWDKLFGTYYYPGPCTSEMGALKTGVEDKNALLIYIYPFQEWARLIKQTFSSETAKSEISNTVDESKSSS